MFDKLMSAIKIDSKIYISEYFSTDIGTRQSCSLSPTLFNLFLNDLPNILSTNNCPEVLNE